MGRRPRKATAADAIPDDVERAVAVLAGLLGFDPAAGDWTLRELYAAADARQRVDWEQVGQICAVTVGAMTGKWHPPERFGPFAPAAQRDPVEEERGKQLLKMALTQRKG